MKDAGGRNIHEPQYNTTLRQFPRSAVAAQMRMKTSYRCAVLAVRRGEQDRAFKFSKDAFHDGAFILRVLEGLAQ